MTDKEKIEELKKENKELKKKLSEKENISNNSAWDFYWDGKGDYLEAQRCFYGDFS